MQKDTFMPDEISLGGTHSLFNAYNGHDNQEFLLFICSAEDHTLNAVNFRCLQFLKNSFPLTGEEDFFSDNVHPEDFPLFLHLLSNYDASVVKTESMATIRFKSGFGNWKKFQIEIRSYGGFEKEKEEFLLILAKPFGKLKLQGRKKGLENVNDKLLNLFKIN